MVAERISVRDRTGEALPSSFTKVDYIEVIPGANALLNTPAGADGITPAGQELPGFEQP